jgi:hypothetical protein
MWGLVDYRVMREHRRSRSSWARVGVALVTLTGCGPTALRFVAEDFVRERAVVESRIHAPPDADEAALRAYLPADFIVRARVVETGRWRIPSPSGGYRPISYSVLDVVDRIAGDGVVSGAQIIVYIEGSFVGPNGECGLVIPIPPRFSDGTQVSGALPDTSAYFDSVGEEMILFGRPSTSYPTARPPELVTEYDRPITVLGVAPLTAEPLLRQILAEPR